MALAEIKPQEAPQDQVPGNIPVEQALLGILLYDNSAFEYVEGLQPWHFREPFHSTLFEEIERCVRAGRLAEPILVDSKVNTHPHYVELGAIKYLADLVEHAPPTFKIRDYANEIIDLATARELIRASGDIVTVAKDGSLTAREKIEAAEASIFALAVEGQLEKGPQPFSEAVRGAIETAGDAYRRDGGLSGLATGLADLDRKLGGLHPSDLIVLASRPGMGKTALGTNVAFHAASHGHPTAFFSLEMSADQLAMRVLADVAGVTSDAIRRGDINEFEYRRMREAGTLIEKNPLYIDESGALSISRLCARARRLKRKHAIELIVVDYLQLATTDSSRRDFNRVQEVSQITGALKALAKELKIPVLALAQLSRKVEDRDDKRPHLADLRESGSIEQDADVVMFLFREAYYLQRSEPKDGDARRADWLLKFEDCRRQAELIIAKQRHGPTGTVRLVFEEDRTKFSNAAREEHYAPPPARYAYGGARD